MMFSYLLLHSQPLLSRVAQNSYFIVLTDSVGQEFGQGPATTDCPHSTMSRASDGETRRLEVTTAEYHLEVPSHKHWLADVSC